MTYPAHHSPLFVRMPALACLALAVWPTIMLPPLRAQLVPDGGTATLANVTNTLTGTVTVGTNGSFTRLTLADNARLTNSGRGAIGVSATARSNQVHLVSPSARWQMADTLFVGSNGPFNRLVISNGAQVIAASAGISATIGQTANSAGNLALVTGAGSFWSNAFQLNIGSSGAGNQLVVSNGGRVQSEFAYVGLLGTSTDNRVTVAGAGSLLRSVGILIGLNGTGQRLSVLEGGGLLGRNGEINGGSIADVTGAGTYWTNTDAFQVGSGGAGSQLTVSDGAVVTAGLFGSVGGGSGASLNTATVTDPGSRWLIHGDLYVGRDGPLNRLNVNNGGLVAATNLFVGFQPTATNNRVVVNGGTLRVTNSAGTGVLDVRRGTNVLIAGLMDADRLLLTNTAGHLDLLGGTLVTRGASVNNGQPMTIGRAGGGPVVWDMRPGVFNHGASLGVVVGAGSSGNQLLVTGGALLTNGLNAGIGSGGGGFSNSATISGPNSRWRVGGNMDVGAIGALNRLTVSDGGRVDSASGRLGVSSPAASNNLAVVTGAGSVWSNAASMIVGDVGPGNQLHVSDGGLVVSSAGSVGQSATANTNSVLVSGMDSEWLLTGNLAVGGSGSFNRLLVSGGARVADLNGTVGQEVASSNNVVVVTDPGSLWSHFFNCSVGNAGDGNLLVVSNGGRVVNGSGFIGAFISDNNAAVVTGSGSVWSNAFDLFVGDHGRTNRLTVSDGGLVVSRSGYIGSVGFFRTGNELVVTGPGSLWSNQLDLFVGHSGSADRLVITDGGRAQSGNVVVGESSAASNNVALVTGPGARWNIATNFSLGNTGSHNRLVVSNGAAMVSGGNAHFGGSAGGSNNVAVVTGAGSSWSNALDLNLGFSGSANQLQVLAGGTVALGGLANLGHFAESMSNGVVVAGPGSRFLTATDLLVGNRGSFNRLTVSNGGFVGSVVGAVGRRPTAANNLAVVTGAGSVWSNSLFLAIGASGPGNQLVVGSGGTVSGGDVVVGEFADSIHNRVTVNGGTLRASSGTGGFGTLDVRRGTNMLNSGLVDVGQLVATNRGTIPSGGVFGNGSSNGFPNTGTAALYPSTIAVAGLAGTVTNVTVTLSNLTHSNSKGLDILLVGPAGHKVMLMSDVGTIFSRMTNVMLTFDDSAATSLPETGTFVSGTYRPSDYPPDQTMPGPAPAGPYSTSLSSFSGSNPNGVWSLYINNDTGTDTPGNLLGWQVRVHTDEPFLDSGAFALNGGTLITRGAVISNDLPFVVGGPGGVPAVWEARGGAADNVVAQDLLVGSSSSFNQLVIPSGVVVAGSNVIVGASPASSNNLLRVTGGTLRVLNPGTVLDVQRGTNRIEAGLVDVLHLLVTNTLGQVEVAGGTLRTPDTVIANGRAFTVGNGPGTATLQLFGGAHLFSNNLSIATNGSLIGNGFIDGTVNVLPGGRLAPGAPIGGFDVDGTIILQGTANLQIDKSGGLRTSDEVMASGAIFYGGTLNVTHIGTDDLAAGDRFFLFDGTPYVGAFTTLNLPPLGSGLSWRNNLSMDGSIEVIAAPSPGFASIVVQSGTNVVISGTNGTPNAAYAVLAATNVALPAASWVSIATNQFNASGQFSFTNRIVPGIPQRFFRLRVP